MTSPNQPALFPVDQTTPAVCPVCHATRPAGQPRTTECEWEHTHDGKRPTHCLNAHQPAHAPIPY